MTKKEIFSSIFLTCFWIIIFYISWIIWILEFILSLSIYSLLFFFFHNIWSKIRKKESLDIFYFLSKFLGSVSTILFVLIFILWSFAYYNNETAPAPMPNITISNWEKTISFQAMSHVWTQDFYNKVATDIKEKKTNGYVYFFEWVQWWTEENTQKFDEAIWIKFDKNLYKNFSKLYWVVYQNNNDFLWLVNDLDFNVDLTIDEIVEHYEKWETSNDNTKPPLDVNQEILNTLAELNDKQLKVLVYINQSILNFLIKSEWLRDFITENIWNPALFDVILNKRNSVLSDAIIESEYDKI